MLASGRCVAQMQPADSLVGSYIGECHYKILSTDSWTINPGVILMASGYPTAQYIDTVNCSQVWLKGCYWYSQPGVPFYTKQDSSH